MNAHTSRNPHDLIRHAWAASLITLVCAAMCATGGTTHAGEPAVAGTSQPILLAGPATMHDVDRDGIPDVVFQVWPPFPIFPLLPGDLVWRRGRGDTSFEPPQVLLEDLTSPTGFGTPYLVSLDANDDGLDDLLVLPLHVLRSLPGGGFGAPVPLPSGLQTSINRGQFDVADLTGDGRQDLVYPGMHVPTGGGAPVSGALLLTNRGDLGFDVSVVAALGSGETLLSLVTGDFQGNGTLDVVVFVQTSTGMELRFVDGLGGGAFAPPEVSALPANVTFLTAAVTIDQDHDGHLDLVCRVSFSFTKAALLMIDGRGDGSFTLGNLLPTSASPPWFTQILQVADVNGDGLDDLVVPDPQGLLLGVLPGRPAGGFAPERSFDLGFTSIYDLVPVDLDGDSAADFVATDLANQYIVRGGESFISLGGGVLGSPASSTLSASGHTQAHKRVKLALHSAAPFTPALIFLGDSLQYVPTLGAPFGVQPFASVFVLAPTEVIARWPDGLPDGATFYVQAWVLGGATGFTPSNIVALVAETP